ncbi:MAG: septum formation initiator family protein [Chloroflexi bacterium]|nr:septum formation initiator family protein [Chloroflexota bacterium]
MSRIAISFTGQALTVLVSVLVSLYFTVALGQRTFQVYQLKQEEVRLQGEVMVLELRNRQLSAQRDRLLTDTDIEKVAREELNLVKPGETAVIVLSNRQPAEGREQEAATQSQEEAETAPFWQRLWSWLTAR